MKVIITGASGMIGKGVLLECLDHTEVTEVLSIGRRTLDIKHPKLKQIAHKDFSEFESISDQLTGYDACYACMGVSSAGMKEEQYKTMTYDYTMALANVLHGLNSRMTFIYVSGQGTDSTEKGRVMWARVKGKTENEVFKLGFNQAFVFRPGAIIPMRGVESSSKLYNFLIKNLGWLIRLMKRISPNSVVNSRQIGIAMINASAKGFEKKVIGPKEILMLAD